MRFKQYGLNNCCSYRLFRLCARPTGSSRRSGKSDINREAFRVPSSDGTKHVHSVELSVPTVSSLNLSDRNFSAPVGGQDPREQALALHWQRFPESAPLGSASAVGSTMRRARTDTPRNSHDQQIILRTTTEQVNDSGPRVPDFRGVPQPGDQPVQYIDPNQHMWHLQGRPHATGGNPWPHRYP